MKIDLGNNKIVETKYNIGDIVTVYKYGWEKVPEETLFYLDEKDENGYNKQDGETTCPVYNR